MSNPVTPLEGVEVSSPDLHGIVIFSQPTRSSLEGVEVSLYATRTAPSSYWQLPRGSRSWVCDEVVVHAEEKEERLPRGSRSSYSHLAIASSIK
jgi:hypothetical protein